MPDNLGPPTEKTEDINCYTHVMLYIIMHIIN